jgi:hypothetical protein
MKFKVGKLESGITIYTRMSEGRGQKGQLILMVRGGRERETGNPVRNFFRIFFQADWSEKNVVTRLEIAIKELVSIESVGIWVDKELIYIAVNDENTRVWLIRDLKVLRLVGGTSAGNSLSGKMKPGDCFLFCMGGDRVIEEENQLVQISVRLRQMNFEFKTEDVFRFLREKDLVGGVIWVKRADEAIRQPTPEINAISVSTGKMDKVNRWLAFGGGWRRLLDRTGGVKDMVWRLIAKWIYSWGFLFNWLLSHLPNQESLYAIETRDVKQQIRSRNRRILLTLALIMLIGLTVSVSWGIKQRRQMVWNQKFGELLEEVRFRLEEGKKLAELNPERTRELMTQAKGFINTLRQRGMDSDELFEFEERVGRVMGLASGERQAVTETWLNLGLIRQDLIGDEMARYLNFLALIDKSSDRVLLIDMKDKSAKVIASRDQVGELQSVGIYDRRVYVLSDLGIWRIDDETRKLFEIDSEWQKTITLEMYAGNIYLASSSGIWRYPVVEAGFGNKSSWLEEGTSSIDKSVSMAIDGFVWLAEEDGLVRKFARGVEDNFTIKKLEIGLSEIKDLYVDENGRFLYILEPGRQRIVLLDKESGIYKEQFVADEFSDARSLVVNENSGEMFILVGDRILRVNM